MASDLTPSSLGILLSFGNGKTSPPRSKDGDYPVYGSNGVIGYADESNADANTIIIGRVGSYCGSLYFSKQKCWVTDNAIRATARDGNDARFAYYLLSTLNLNNMRAGSGQPLLNQSILSGIDVRVPVPDEQRAISAVLGPMDDKIELNRRLNETLVDTARTLFKSWFVDFDPVRARAEGRDPGLPKSLSDLFPDSFQDSGLGEIPTGWKEGVVGDLGEVVCGKTPPTSDEENYGIDIPFVTIPDMHGKVFVTETNKSLSIKGAATQSNKTLPPNAVCVSCIATVGLVALTSKRCQTNQQINSVMPVDPASTLYCYFAIRERSKEIQSRGSGGSVLLNLNKSQFSALPILIPSSAILAEYQRLAKPMFDKILFHEHENQNLALLRDTLLPRLVSGKLRLPDAERIVGGQL